MTSQLAFPTLLDLVVTTQWLPLHLSSNEATAMHDYVTHTVCKRVSAVRTELVRVLGYQASVCEGSIRPKQQTRKRHVYLHGFII